LDESNNIDFLFVMKKKLIMSSVIFGLLTSIGFAKEKKDSGYFDIFSIQMDHRNSWDILNLGLNLSRYFATDYLGTYNLYPGIGVRAKVGEDPKIEVFPKIGFAGIFGGSLGGVYGARGVGLGASLWAGLEMIGVESSWYSYMDRNRIDQEVSIYFAYQFGYKFGPEYELKNFILELGSAF
jgi:hypothetical protein